VVVTPAALEYYQETFRQLAFEYAECWFLCCKAEDACRAEHLARTRRKMMATNGGAAVPWSVVLVAAADDTRYWDREVRRPAMLYLARGKKGGEPTAAYEEDPTGITAKVKAQLQSGAHDPPPVADPTSPKKRKRTAAQRKAKLTVTTYGAPPGGGGGQNATQSQNGGHPKSQAGKYITSREGIEICFTFAKNARDACPEPCRNKRAHLCQICLGPHRNEECDRSNNLGKGGKGGKGK